MKTKEELFRLFEAGKTDDRTMQQVVELLADYMQNTYPLEVTYCCSMPLQKYPHSPYIYCGRIDFVLNDYTYRTQRICALIEHIYAEPADEQTLMKIVYNII